MTADFKINAQSSAARLCFCIYPGAISGFCFSCTATSTTWPHFRLSLTSTRAADLLRRCSTRRASYQQQ
jgi:hypothetical protein